MKQLKVLVVGAGIGGLQTALALATDGHSVVVFESVKEFLEVRIRKDNLLLNVVDARRSVQESEFLPILHD